MKKLKSSRIKVETANFVPSGMDQNEVDELRKAFQLFNLDDDRVEVAELLDEMKSSGLDERYPSAMSVLNEVDNSGDGFLDFNQFLQVMTTDIKTANDEISLARLYSLLDVENEGALDSEQVRKLFSEVGEDFNDEEWGMQFSRLDVDEDKKFDYTDFLNAIGKNNAEE